MKTILPVVFACVVAVLACWPPIQAVRAEGPTATPQSDTYNTVVPAEVPSDWAQAPIGPWSVSYPGSWEAIESAAGHVEFRASGAKVCDLVVENNPLPLAVDDPRAIDIYSQGVIKSTRTEDHEVRILGVGRWLRGVLGLYFDMESVDQATGTSTPVTAVVTALGPDHYVRLTLLSATPENLKAAGAILSSLDSAARIAQDTPAPLKPAGTLSGELTIGGSTTFQPLAAKLADAFRVRYPKVRVDVAGGGSKVGIQAAHEGTVDLGMVSRDLKPEEETGIQMHKVALDAVAMVVHPSNPVKGLSVADLSGIYSGQVTNWSQLGGSDQPIVVVVREKTSGTRGAFDDIVLGGKEPSAPDQRAAMTAGDVAATVAAELGAIGYLGFGNLEPGIKVLTIDGVTPSAATVRDESYKLRRPLALLTGALSQPMSRDFVAFALSPEGQKIVSDNGWVPVR